MSTNPFLAILPTALILGSLVIMASCILSPIRAKPVGNIEYELRLGLFQRVLSQKVNIVSICVLVALGGGVLGGSAWLTPILGYIALAVMIGLLFVPQKVIFTSVGFMPGRAIFRPWKDFQSCSISGRRLTFTGRSRFESLKLFASGRNVAEVERVVRRHLRSQQASARPRSKSAGKARSTRGTARG